MRESGEDQGVRWAAAWRPHPRERVCGDLHVVAAVPGYVLAAVVDGLGHGPEAEAASRVAGAILARDPSDMLDALFRRCHDAMRRTRGAAISLARFDLAGRTLSWAGVGNVEGVLTRPAPLARERLLLIGGVVGGASEPRVRTSSLAIRRGDRLLLATDGVDPVFASQRSTAPPKEFAADLLDRCGTGVDDALVLVVDVEALP